MLSDLIQCFKELMLHQLTNLQILWQAIGLLQRKKKKALKYHIFNLWSSQFKIKIMFYKEKKKMKNLSSPLWLVIILEELSP